MGVGDKIQNKAEEVGGQAKEAVGDATGNEQLQAEGAADQAGAKLKQAGESVVDGVKDTIEDAKAAFKKATN